MTLPFLHDCPPFFTTYDNPIQTTYRIVIGFTDAHLSTTPATTAALSTGSWLLARLHIWKASPRTAQAYFESGKKPGWLSMNNCENSGVVSHSRNIRTSAG